MADTCSWDSIPSSGGEMSDFLRLQSGNSYKIRPVFDPVSFYKFFHKQDGKLRTAIIDKKQIANFLSKHEVNKLKKPSLRFAAYVIDRADGKVKILEAPQTVFRPIGTSLEMTGKNPGGGKDGSDWYIKVTGTGLNTTYEVGQIGFSPLTPDERSLIKEALDGDKDKLKKLYKIDTPEQIEEKLFGDGSKEQGGGATATQAPPAQTAAPAQEAPVAAGGGDDFDNEW